MEQTEHATHLAAGTDSSASSSGGFVSLDGVEMYRISDFDRMRPFLVSVVSASDHWLYVASAGGLAAGRVKPERSLFPYETDDRLYRAGATTGPFTLLRVTRTGSEPVLWQPFGTKETSGSTSRNIYKSLVGDTLTFEESREDLGTTFRYTWGTSAKYGFVRTSTLLNNDPSRTVSVAVVDGLRNIMPANVPLNLQQASSTLVEAYRRNEVDLATSMAIYSLEARVNDRAEPAESLQANIIWSTGMADPAVLLSTDQIGQFRKGLNLRQETLTHGRHADYLLNGSITLAGSTSTSWSIIGDVYQSQIQVQRRRTDLLSNPDIALSVARDIVHGSDRLRHLVATADGDQCGKDRLATTHHFANTLFNCMRGGVFLDNGIIPVADLARFLQNRNHLVRRTHQAWLSSLGDSVSRHELLRRAATQGDPDLERLCYEYLPLIFSRRHGDPSRPWNTFEIRIQDDDGNQILDYQGNWRDIFQNWEALCYSFPVYLESIVSKFVNASTVDGFNPYRVTRDGIDWETPDPENPWSNIGYWGDHQIVYLLRLLEALSAFDATALPNLLDQELFSYADVPYRIQPYDAIVRNSKSTIEFDSKRNREISDRTAIVGSDGRLVTDHNGAVLHVTLAEKLLVPVLSKISNLVIDGGIWMNTQRPEWNDANNALVGYGLSMVTLSYLRRYLAFCEDLFDSAEDDEFLMSTEVATWMEQTRSTLTTYHDRLDQPLVSDRRRKRLLDRLGHTFSEYRAAVYRDGFSGKAKVSATSIVELCRVALDYTDHSIRASKQESGLFHSYNLLHLADDGEEIAVEPLPVMLEGQVAALSSGLLSSEEALTIVDALFQSPLHRPDQGSFILYPAQELPSFLERNTIVETAVEANPLLLALLEAGDTSVVERDSLGACRFSPSVADHSSLMDALDHLSTQPDWTELVAAHRVDIDDVFEHVFQHRRFTGRSGSMYKYEGLGSIYWHMVAKLLLAIQETFWNSRSRGEPAETQDALADAYFRIRSGLSSDKTPSQYGAFPTDPYSHSPSHMGAQQPGMTGQVKEEVLTRWGELGIRIEDGTIGFDPVLLRQREFLTEQQDWAYHDVSGHKRVITLQPGSIAFTYCQVPIMYSLGNSDQSIEIEKADGTTLTLASPTLDAATSAAIFQRRGEITTIEVTLAAGAITRQ